LTKKLKNIVHYYGIDIPIEQIKGKNNIDFQLILPFETQKIQMILNLNIKNAKLKFDDLLFATKDIDITFENHILKVQSRSLLLDALKQKTFLNNFDLVLDNNIAYVNTNVIDANKNSFEIKNSVDLSKKIVKGSIFINTFNYDNLVKIKKQKMLFTIDYKKELDMDFYINNKFIINEGKLVLNMSSFNFKDNKVYINATINDKSKNTVTYSSVVNLKNKTINGNILINNYKYKHYIDMNMRAFDFSLNYKDGINAYIKDFDLQYNSRDSIHSLYIGKLNKILNYILFVDVKKWNPTSTVQLYTENNFSNINVVFSNLNIKINDKLFTDEEKEQLKETSKVLLPKTEIILVNTSLEYMERILTTHYSILKTNGENIFLEIKPVDENASIKVLLKGDKIFMDAKNLSEDFLNKLANKKLFKGGSVNISANGDSENIKGKIELTKTKLRNVIVLNNLITFVNTTPAIINPLLVLPTLFRMGETGFDLKGYFIKQGEVDFNYNIKNKYMKLSSFETSSTMTDFTGSGEIDIKNNNIDLNVDVIFLKDYSKFIKHIPILGYIIVGDDGNFVTNVDIQGTMEEQSFTTHTIRNASEGFFNMIKRTIGIPLIPFSGNNTYQNAKQHKEIVDSIINNEEN
jgi:hypothetical protein